mmetsp:Transcript_41760/g.91079  ORF Transcript_41760/g.91079 Transcript_41760/m.91079 type:complete len:273 (-) Transcript_41760:289-1107(-)
MFFACCCNQDPAGSYTGDIDVTEMEQELGMQPISLSKKGSFMPAFDEITVMHGTTGPETCRSSQIDTTDSIETEFIPVMSPQRQPQPPERQPPQRQISGQRRGREPASGSTPRDKSPRPSSLSPSAREAEMRRLRRVVASFADKAKSGCPCLFLSGSKVYEAEYSLDLDMTVLTVTRSDDDTEILAVCPMESVQKVYSSSEDGTDWFSADVLAAAALEGHDAQQLLLKVVFIDQTGRNSSFCLMENSTAACVEFLESLRILNIYAGQLPKYH